MKKLAWATEDKLEDADWVVLGVPDEKGSHSYRSGSSRAPDVIRAVSHERAVFVRKGAEHIVEPQKGTFKHNLFDMGNIRRSEIRNEIRKLLSAHKKPITIGGDHSITFEILKAVNDVSKDISIIYFDAHPDFICSSRNYYGSVMCDAVSLKNINIKKSIEIGVRAPEREELVNLKKRQLKVITPMDIAEKGIKKIVAEIKKTVGKNVYLSIDLDVLDPAFAPGVSTPVPGGLTSNEFFYLIKEVSKLNLIGCDLTEVTPKYDIQDMTAHLAAKAIAEIISR